LRSFLGTNGLVNENVSEEGPEVLAKCDDNLFIFVTEEFATVFNACEARCVLRQT